MKFSSVFKSLNKSEYSVHWVEFKNKKFNAVGEVKNNVLSGPVCAYGPVHTCICVHVPPVTFPFICSCMHFCLWWAMKHHV